MAIPDVDLCDAAALREHAAYLDLLREIGRHGGAAAETLASAYTASTGEQRLCVLALLGEQLASAVTAVHDALTAIDREAAR